MEKGFFGAVVILVGLVFIFGGSKRLGDLGKGFGSFMHEFNKAKNQGTDEAAKMLKDKEEQAKVDEKKP
jgi:Sec-independent protein translocase protein TatA